MNSTDQKPTTTASKTDLELSIDNLSCPTVPNMCLSSIHSLKKSAGGVSGVSRTLPSHRLLLWIVFVFCCPAVHSPVHPIKKSAGGVSGVFRTLSSRRFLLWIAFVFCFTGYSLGDKPMRPQNQAASKGTKVQVNCATETEFRYWRYQNFLRKDKDEVVYGGVNIYEDFRALFSIDKSTEGHHDLTFTASDNTSGSYTCRPDKISPEYSAEVIVLDATPSCSKEFSPGFLKANCTIGYSGYWPPRLEWHNASETLETSDTTKITNRKVTSSLTLPFNNTDPPYTLTCKVKFTIEDKPKEDPTISVPPKPATNIPEFPTFCTLKADESVEVIVEQPSIEGSIESTPPLPLPLPSASPPPYSVGLVCVFASALPLWSASNCFTSA